ncbi:MAG: hypothetical protein NC084_07740 [Bacteroides sp.]|nr:hypothetical protein [Eubacterium sp.]MCM1418531.1 hypothetical protein [Roseburia sp.]MCM1462588.1 hypothetical protein [Bacteroides sp.]
MRTGAKRLLSALIAVTATASFATSVYAADYAADPGYSSTVTTTPAVSTEKLDEAITKLDDLLKDAEDGEAAPVVTVEVASTESLQVSAATVKALAEKAGGVLELKAEEVTFAIDVSTIEKAAKLDLRSTVTNTSTVTTITMKTSRKFNCEIKAVITNCKLSKKALAKAHVYRNGVDLGPVELDENGYPVITMTRGGTYEIK